MARGRPAERRDHGLSLTEEDIARPPIHPGDILSDELRDQGMSAAELARLIHVPSNQLSQILSGKRNITADPALRLGLWFGTGPQLWLNLQQAYALDPSWQWLGEELEAVEPRVQIAVNAVGIEDMAKPDDLQDG
jgi:antitoxin HigA-1